MQDSKYLELVARLRPVPDLAPGDLQLVESALRELSARQRLDLLDARWERDMARHIRRHRGGRLYIANRSDGIIGVVVGVCLAAYGAHMLTELAGGTQNWAVSPAVFYVGIILTAGAAFIAVGVKALKRVGLHRQERTRYEADRKVLVEHLPSEFQRPTRFCPSCLNQD